MLTIAIQKKGRLTEKTLKLLTECGLKLENGSKDRLTSRAENFPLTLLYLRDDDIPGSIYDGIADGGIAGENIFAEENYSLKVREKLGFARCRLSIAVPKSMSYSGIDDLAGKKIATSYPNILSKYLSEHNVAAQIHEIKGSVEIAPGIGMSDAIFDITSTGSTLISNGLKEVEIIQRSEAVLVTGKSISADKKEILEKLLFRIRAVKKANSYKYILLNAPKEKLETISQILPGMKSPTVMPLALPDWYSIHSVIKEDDFWENIEKLKKEGAEGILVFPIEKMIM